MTTTEQIEEELRKDFDVENKDDLKTILFNFLKDITHNFTLRNIKRTFVLLVDIFRWLGRKQ